MSALLHECVFVPDGQQRTNVTGPRLADNPPTTTTSALHTWPENMTSQWQSQLAGHPTPATHKTLEKRGGEGSWFI